MVSPNKRGRAEWSRSRWLCGRREEGPRGSDAVRVVPMRGFSWVIASRLRGSGRRGLEGGALVKGDVRARERGLLGGEVEAAMNAGRIGSFSGGGVGGNMLRWTGGSDCCLDLLYRFDFTI